MSIGVNDAHCLTHDRQDDDEIVDRETMNGEP